MNCALGSLRIPAITAVLNALCFAGALATAAAQDQSIDLTVVADQVRSQGFACKNPISAERVEAESAPNHTVYLLKCENITYRVVLIPDQAAEVTETK